MDPVVQTPKDFAENSLFWINQDFSIIKNGKIQRRGKVLFNLNLNLFFFFNFFVYFQTDKFDWSTAIEYGTFTAGGQSVHCAVAHFENSRSHHKNYENEKKTKQCIASGKLYFF